MLKDCYIVDNLIRCYMVQNMSNYVSPESIYCEDTHELELCVAFIEVAYYGPL